MSRNAWIWLGVAAAALLVIIIVAVSLHGSPALSLLPRHERWGDFLFNLKYVVIDEAHTYRGVFGSQVACVLRRLRRVCAVYGSEPQFIATSATIANPGELVSRLIGRQVEVIDNDGSPAVTFQVDSFEVVVGVPSVALVSPLTLTSEDVDQPKTFVCGLVSGQAAFPVAE